jgi:hypothetical protein
MRLKIIIWLPVLVGGFLLLQGLRPDALPFVPEALFSDAAVSHWPAALHLQQAVWEQGAFPDWQTIILGGQPFAANPLNKTAYPLQWLAVLLPPALHLNGMILLHLLLAGWGMWRFARQQGVSSSAALFSALAYALAPKLLAHLGAGHLDLLYALAWWPWLMSAVFRLVSSSGLNHALQAGLCAGLLVLADVRLSLFALTVAAAWGLWLTLQQRQARPVFWGLLAGGLAALLALAVISPVLIWQPYLSRAAMSVEDAGVFALESGHFVGLLLPPHSGNPETLTYLGLSVLLLAGVAAVTAPRRYGFWVAVSAVAALYALGNNGPLWPLLVEGLPLLRGFRVPSRAWFVVVFVASWLAGCGLDRLADSVRRLRQGHPVGRLVFKRLAVAGGIGASLFCGGFTLAALTDLPATIGLGVMAVGGLTGFVLLMGFYGRFTPERLAHLLIIILFLDLTWTGRNWLEWRPPAQWLTHQQALADVLLADNPARIYSPNYSLEQQVAAVNGLSLFYGVDPFQLSGIVDAIEQGSGVPVSAYSVVLPPLDLEVSTADGLTPAERLRTANWEAVPDTHILAQWGVSHVVTTYSLSHPRLELYETVASYFIYRNMDYKANVLLSSWGWPVDGWPGLPDAAAVELLNRGTRLAALVSAVGLIGSLILLLWRLLRR